MTITSGSESSEILENNYPEVSESKCSTESSKHIEKKVKKPHQCDFEGCSARFSRPWRLQAHKAVHLGKKPFPCDLENCNKAYTSNYHLRRHKITAHAIKEVAIKLIKCRHPGCSQEFKTNQFEKKHFIRAHIEKTCTECGKQFFKRSQWRKHLISHSQNPFTCKECNLSFEHLGSLNRHKRGHVIHLCPIKTCMESFKNWSSLRKHLKSHPYDFVCGYCRKGYRNKRFLEAHIIRHMNGTVRKQSQLKKYLCHICQTVVSGKASLKRHISNIHEHPKIKSPSSVASTSKSRAPRKDKGIPKKSFASVLSELEVPKELHTSLIEELPEEECLNVLCLENY